MRVHDEARANAAETIFNMSCSEIPETIDQMANHAGLLECLAVTLRSGDHTGLEIKMYCMAELIGYPMCFAFGIDQGIHLDIYRLHLPRHSIHSQRIVS